MMRKRELGATALALGLVVAPFAPAVADGPAHQRPRPVHRRAHLHLRDMQVVRPLRIRVGVPVPTYSGESLLCPRKGDVDASCTGGMVKGRSVVLLQPPSPLEPLGSSELHPPYLWQEPQTVVAYEPVFITSSGFVANGRAGAYAHGFAGPAGYAVAPMFLTRSSSGSLNFGGVR